MENCIKLHENVSTYFLLGKKMGEGSFGNVYKAYVNPEGYALLPYDAQPYVAIKHLKHLRNVDSTESGMIINEIKNLKSFKLKRSVRYYGCFANKDGLYIVMELIDGVDLFDLIMDNTLLSNDKLFIAKEVALAIAECHKAGLVHRDIKPENIMVQFRLNDTPIIKLIDYGLSCNTIENPLWEGCHTPMGTREYYDYKITLGDIDSMKRADWWAYGQVIALMFSHKLPYEGILGPNEYIRIPKGLHGLLDTLTDPNIDQNERPSESDIIKTLNDNMKNQWYKTFKPASKRMKRANSHL